MKMRLPSDWRRKPLHELAEVRTGLSKNSNRRGTTVKLPYLRVANVQDGALDLSDVQEIDVPANQISRFSLRSGDLLLIEGNGNPQNLGRGCLWKGQISNIVHQNHIFAVRTHAGSKLLPEFLELQVQADYGRNYFLSCAKGSTGLSSLNSTQLNEFPVIVPPLVEQQRIVEAISAWDAAIEKTGRILQAKQCLLAFYRRRVFCSGEMPGLRPTRLRDVLWEHGHLSDGVAPVYSVSVHKGLVNQIEHLGRSFAASDRSNYNLVHPADVVYTKSPTGDFPFGIVKQNMAGRDVIVSPLYGVFTPSDSDVGLLIDFFFESPAQARNYLRPLIQKGAKNTINITNSGFLSGAVVLPESQEVQREIAGFIKDARHELSLLEGKLASLRQQKRGLVRMVLAGKRRISLPQAEVA